MSAELDAGPFQLGDVGGMGPAVLCLHGLTGTPYEVRPPAEELARLGFACYGPILPGHGESPRQLAATPFSSWVDAVLQAHDWLAGTHDQVFVLGQSMGGLLALRLAQLRSVAGLALLAAPLRLGFWVHHLVPLLARVLESVPKTPAIADPEARRRHPGYSRMPLPAVRELIRLQTEVRPLLGRITAPLLLIYSPRDPTVPAWNADWIASEVSSQHREVHLLARSLHVITVDVERVEVARRTGAFFGKLRAAGTVDGPP